MKVESDQSPQTRSDGLDHAPDHSFDHATDDITDHRPDGGSSRDDGDSQARPVARRGRPGLDEETIVARAQDGDVTAFEQLVDRYQRPLYGLAYRMLRDRGEAEDVVQEALITAWRRLPMLARPGAFGGWIFKVATNRSLDVLRRRATRRTDVVDDEILTRTPDLAPDPQAAAQHRAETDDLGRALANLTDEQRACWLLREIHGRSYAEIAATVGVTETAVRGRIARARQQLAEGMESWR